MSWKTFKWNMVNVTASYSPKHFFWKLYVIIRPWPSWQQILHFSQVLESIHKFKKKFHTLQCLFLGALISNKWGVGSFQIYDNQVLLGVILQCCPLLAPSKNGLPLLFTLAKKKIYLDTQLKRKLTNLFWKLPVCSLFPQAEQK